MIRIPVRSRLLGLAVAGLLATSLVLLGHGSAEAAGIQITGTVTNQSNAGVQNVSVTATAPGGTSVLFGPIVTAADGSYQLVVDPGTYDLHFTPPGGSGLNPVVDPNIVVTADQVSNVQLENTTLATHVLSGTLTDQNGHPIRGADIALSAADGNSAQGQHGRERQLQHYRDRR